MKIRNFLCKLVVPLLISLLRNESTAEFLRDLAKKSDNSLDDAAVDLFLSNVEAIANALDKLKMGESNAESE